MSGGFFSLAQQILDAYALQVGFSAHPGDLCSCLNLFFVLLLHCPSLDSTGMLFDLTSQ